MPLIERRYAEALAGLASESNAIDAYQEEFEAVAGIYRDQPEFRLFLSNPEVKVEAKKTVVRNAFSGFIRAELMNFLLLLIDKGRITLLPGILNEYISLADRERNVLKMTIISAEPLEGSQVDYIKEKYRIQYNASYVKAELNVDRSILGGVKLVIGDSVIDGSVKGRLQSLKEQLIKA